MSDMSGGLVPCAAQEKKKTKQSSGSGRSGGGTSSSRLMSGCSGVFFQILDGFQGRRLFPQKRLTAAERPKRRNQRRHEKLPMAKLLLIADEKRVGSYDEEQMVVVKNEERAAQDAGRATAARPPPALGNIIARLMGLETIPSAASAQDASFVGRKHSPAHLQYSSIEGNVSTCGRHDQKVESDNPAAPRHDARQMKDVPLIMAEKQTTKNEVVVECNHEKSQFYRKLPPLPPLLSSHDEVVFRFSPFLLPPATSATLLGVATAYKVEPSSRLQQLRSNYRRHLRQQVEGATKQCRGGRSRSEMGRNRRGEIVCGRSGGGGGQDCCSQQHQSRSKGRKSQMEVRSRRKTVAQVQQREEEEGSSKGREQRHFSPRNSQSCPTSPRCRAATPSMKNTASSDHRLPISSQSLPQPRKRRSTNTNCVLATTLDYCQASPRLSAKRAAVTLTTITTHEAASVAYTYPSYCYYPWPSSEEANAATVVVSDSWHGEPQTKKRVKARWGASPSLLLGYGEHIPVQDAECNSNSARNSPFQYGSISTGKTRCGASVTSGTSLELFLHEPLANSSAQEVLSTEVDIRELFSSADSLSPGREEETMPPRTPPSDESSASCMRLLLEEQPSPISVLDFAPAAACSPRTHNTCGLKFRTPQPRLGKLVGAACDRPPPDASSSHHRPTAGVCNTTTIAKRSRRKAEAALFIHSSSMTEDDDMPLCRKDILILSPPSSCLEVLTADGMLESDKQAAALQRRRLMVDCIDEAWQGRVETGVARRIYGPLPLWYVAAAVTDSSSSFMSHLFLDGMLKRIDEWKRMSTNASNLEETIEREVKQAVVGWRECGGSDVAGTVVEAMEAVILGGLIEELLQLL